MTERMQQGNIMNDAIFKLRKKMSERAEVLEKEER